MFLRQKKYWAININSTAIPDKPGLVSSRGRRKAGTGVVFDYARETFLHVIDLYCRPIFLIVRADFNGYTRRLFSMARYGT